MGHAARLEPRFGEGVETREEIALDRRQRHGPRRGPGGCRFRSGDKRHGMRCYPRHRRMFEDTPRRQSPASLAEPRDDLQRQDRIAAKLVEIVADADPFDSKNLGKDPHQQALDLALRRHVGAAPFANVVARGDQRPAVDLAACSLRQGVAEYERVGDQGAREPIGEMGAQLARKFDLRGTDDMRDQTLPRAIIEQQRHGLAHRGVRAQRRVDLAQLHALSVQLDLVVRSSAKLKLELRCIRCGAYPAGAVPAGVEPRTGVARERVGDKAPGGPPGTPGIAARQSGAAEVQVAVGSHRRDLLEGILDDEGGHAVDRLADGRDQVFGPQCAGGRVDGGLGWPIQVDDFDAGTDLAGAQDQFARERLAANEEAAQRTAMDQVGLLQQRAQESWHQLQDADALISYHARQQFRVAMRAVGHQRERGALDRAAPRTPKPRRRTTPASSAAPGRPGRGDSGDASTPYGWRCRDA